MSYYASVSGTLTVEGGLSAAQKAKLFELAAAIGHDYEAYKDGEGFNIDFMSNESYHEDEIEASLKRIATDFTVKPESQLHFIGEDDEQWVYRYKQPVGESRGEWRQYGGKISFVDYGMPDYDELRKMFVDYVTNESERTGDPAAITAQLEAVGCNAKLRKLLGLDYPAV